MGQHIYACYTDVRLYQWNLPASSIRLSTSLVINSFLWLLSIVFKPRPHYFTTIAAVHSVSHSHRVCYHPWQGEINYLSRQLHDKLLLSYIYTLLAINPQCC